MSFTLAEAGEDNQISATPTGFDPARDRRPSRRVRTSTRTRSIPQPHSSMKTLPTGYAPLPWLHSGTRPAWLEVPVRCADIAARKRKPKAATAKEGVLR